MKDSNNKNLPPSGTFSRRRFVSGALGGAAMLGLPLPFSGQAAYGADGQPLTLSGTEFDLDIAYQQVNFTGRTRTATTINGSLPAPVLRWREGDELLLRVTNNLDVESSIHWHGIILPSEMDGVPGLSFDGIAPGETFQYRFQLGQSGTYWYHSHSGFQEQTGMYGAIIIDPLEPEPFDYDRDHVVLLSDWADTSPQQIFSTLRKEPHYYNFNERTVGDLWQQIREQGLRQTWQERAMWNRMRMSDRDISDVTGYVYTYLMNGMTAEQGWTGLFERGDKVRLRFINASAMTIFDIRIPGLKMTVVAADGQNVQPVDIDEFRIGVAETYDVIVEPDAGQAYTLFAQNIDRSGYVFGTLTPDPAWRAEVPAMDHKPVLGHRDMGHADHGDMDHGEMDHSQMDHSQMDHSEMDHSEMDHSGMDHSEMDHSQMDHSQMDHSQMDHSQMDHSQMDHSEMDHSQMDHSQMDHSQMDHSTARERTHAGHSAGSDVGVRDNLGPAGFGSTLPVTHVASEFGPQVDMRVDMPPDGLRDPGVGLREHEQRYGRRVLNYGDLRNLDQTRDRREPDREIALHLTGNMHRYLWSINGIPFSHAEPLHLRYGERVRFTLINDTMMTHPMHLHGMWSELETGDPAHMPRKHTVIVQPGSRISFLVTADARGRWAFHCHLLYHMMGMFREVRVS